MESNRGASGEDGTMPIRKGGASGLAVAANLLPLPRWLVWGRAWASATGHGAGGGSPFLPTVDGAWPADVPDGARQVEDHRQGCATTACASSSWGAQWSLGGGSVRRRLTQSGVAPWLRINYVPTPPRLGRQAPILLSFAVSKKFRWLALIDKQEASISARILASHPARPLPGAARVSWPADDNEDRLQGTA